MTTTTSRIERLEDRLMMSATTVDFGEPADFVNFQNNDDQYTVFEFNSLKQKEFVGNKSGLVSELLPLFKDNGSQLQGDELATIFDAALGGIGTQADTDFLQVQSIGADHITISFATDKDGGFDTIRFEGEIVEEYLGAKKMVNFQNKNAQTGIFDFDAKKKYFHGNDNVDADIKGYFKGAKLTYKEAPELVYDALVADYNGTPLTDITIGAMGEDFITLNVANKGGVIETLVLTGDVIAQAISDFCDLVELDEKVAEFDEGSFLNLKGKGASDVQWTISEDYLSSKTIFLGNEHGFRRLSDSIAATDSSINSFNDYQPKGKPFLTVEAAQTIISDLTSGQEIGGISFQLPSSGILLQFDNGIAIDELYVTGDLIAV